MPYSISDINSYIAKAQRAQATRMVEIVRLERLGNDVNDKYLKCRYISAAIRVLSKPNYAGLGIDDIEKIIHCMIECGDINDFDGSPLTFPPITILAQPCCPTKITDLIDGPMGSLVGNEGKGLRVNGAGTAWEWYTIVTSLLSLKNVVFVAKNGNDATGMLDRLDKPFLTLLAAQSAANSGYTIWVWPGTYTYSSGGLGKAGVNWHFVDGAIASFGAIGFIDTAGISYSISGNGEFIGSTASVILFSHGGTLIMQGKRLENTSGNLVSTSSTSIVYITMQKDIISTNRCFLLAGTSSINVTASLISSTAVVAQSQVAGTTLNIKADLIQSSGSAVFDLTGNANIYGKISYTGTGEVIKGTAAVACNQNFYGDITTTSEARILDYSSAVTGVINFYGTITGFSQIFIQGGLAKFNFYNEIIITVEDSCINMTTGTVKIKSRIINLDVNASSYCIKKTTGTLILEQAILVTSGATECVHSAAAQTMIVYPGTVAKVAVSANITQKVASVLIDNQVQ